MVIFALFLGPWSDRSGRKMLIMLPFFGYFLNCVSFIVNIYFFDELVVEFLWLESLASFFGGYALQFLGAYGYIADTTSAKSRTIRIAIMDAMLSVGETIGSFINSYVFAALGYYGSFGIASGCFLLGLLIVFLTVKDKQNLQNKGTNNNILDFKNFAESFQVLSKQRPESMRHIVIILVLCIQIGMFGFGGANYVDYLYVRRKFEFTDENTLVRKSILFSVG